MGSFNNRNPRRGAGGGGRGKGGGGGKGGDIPRIGSIGVVDATGKPIRRERPIAVANAAMRDLMARVYNLESVMVMLATTVKKGVTDPEHRDTLDVYMEAFYNAQVARGAVHLAVAADDKDGDVFL